MLISCVMPTTDARRPFLEQAFRCFCRQSAACELIAVDDGTQPITLPPNSRRIIVPPGWNIGHKMNAGIEAARGEVIVKWDDDDWYAPTFVETLVRALANRPDAVAAVASYVAFLLDDWQLRYSGGANAFAGGTLCFTKETWRARPFDEKIIIGEDLDFWQERTTRIPVVPAPWVYMMVRHGGNTWRDWNGTSVEAVFRQRPVFPQSLDEFLPTEDVAFYRKLATDLRR